MKPNNTATPSPLALLPTPTASPQDNIPSFPASPLSIPPHENFAGGEPPLTESPEPEVFVAGPPEGGKGGEGGIFQVSNADFVAAIFSDAPKGAFAAICPKSGDPNQGGWIAKRADQALEHLSPENNNYVNCSSFSPEADGSFKVRKDQFAACHALLLDDLGSKFDLDRLGDFKLSSLIETSPGNYQGAIVLKEPITSSAEANALHKRLIDAGLCDPGAGGAATRWMRLPVAINGKPKYQDESGAPFCCRLVEWRPELRYTPEAIIAGLALLPKDGPKEANSSAQEDARTNQGDDVFLPLSAENPVIAGLKAPRPVVTIYSSNDLIEPKTMLDAIDAAMETMQVVANGPVANPFRRVHPWHLNPLMRTSIVIRQIYGN